jgi:hypothetical protein
MHYMILIAIMNRLEQQIKKESIAIQEHQMIETIIFIISFTKYLYLQAETSISKKKMMENLQSILDLQRWI